MEDKKIIAGYLQQQSPYFIGSLLGAGLSIASLAAPIPKILSLDALLISLSFGCGVASTSHLVHKSGDKLSDYWSRLVEENERLSRSRHRQELEAIKTEHESDRLKDGDKIAELTDRLRVKDREFLASLEEAKQIIYKELSEKCHQEYLRKVKAANHSHRLKEQSWAKEFEAKDSEYQQQWVNARARIDDLINSYEQVLASYHPELKEIQSLFQQQMSSVVEERDRVYRQLEKYHDGKRFTGSSKADINGNRLIDFFLNRSITCDASHCESHFEFDEVWIRPRVVRIEDLEKYSSAIHLEFELLSPPQFSIDSGCIRVTLKTHSKEKNYKTKIIDERSDWLLEIIQESNHYRIVAPTDRGKSVLLDNLIAALKLYHSDDFRMTLLDPKFPFTEWSSHKPDYEGFDECLTGLFKLGTLIDNRFKEAVQDRKANKPIREYPFELFAVDELELLFQDARDKDDGKDKGETSVKITRLLRKGLKIGRGLTVKKGKGICVAYVSQSPLCSSLGLRKNDFDQSTNIFLHDAIPRALKEECDSIPQKQLAYLHQQYELRVERGDVYFALVKTPKQAFIASLPSPNYYSQLLETQAAKPVEPTGGMPLDGSDGRLVYALSNEGSGDSVGSEVLISDIPQNAQNQPPSSPLAASLKCVQCSSLSVKKNGKRKGKQAYRCNDCGKNFVV